MAQGQPVSRPPVDPYQLLDQLVRLVRERAEVDEQLGRACLLVRGLAVWRLLGHASFQAYCSERLGLADTTVRQRMVLERRMRSLPELREALRSHRLSYEQARLVARVARPGDVAERIAQAEGKTCIAFRREIESEERGRLRRLGELRTVAPDEVTRLLADAIRSAQLLWRQRHPGSVRALASIALHFIGTWTPMVKRIVAATDEAMLRDGGLCQVPGCSRAADHVHHVVPRSRNGALEGWNETSLCSAHHMQGVHAGNVLVRGRAPDLTFTLGEREAAAARRAAAA